MWIPASTDLFRSVIASTIVTEPRNDQMTWQASRGPIGYNPAIGPTTVQQPVQQLVQQLQQLVQQLQQPSPVWFTTPDQS